jgi:prolyl 4-hydroxylase
MREIIEARALLDQGHVQQGLSLLTQAAKRNNADALNELANLALSGDFVRRDLTLSRELFRQAAAAGSESAAAAYRAVVANGTGGPADWPAALKLLTEAAPQDPWAGRELALIDLMNLSESGESLDQFNEETMSKSPQTTVFHSLFTDLECDFLMDVALPALRPSEVVDPTTGELTENPVRTSDAAAFPLVAERPAIHALCRRLAKATRTGVEQGEPLQVLRYLPGQQYRPHFDALDRSENQRILTILVYLNDDYEGGATHFIKSGLSIKGRKGDALMFRNADDAGHIDANSQHAGEPVELGEKFVASRWIRQRPLLSPS